MAVFVPKFSAGAGALGAGLEAGAAGGLSAELAVVFAGLLWTAFSPSAPTPSLRLIKEKSDMGADYRCCSRAAACA